jgi:hypothetical protein
LGDWVIGQFLKIKEVAQICVLLFPCGKSSVLILAKLVLATFWAIFFAKSSAHPV